MEAASGSKTGLVYYFLVKFSTSVSKWSDAMANRTLVVDCSPLATRNDFKAYISLLLTDGAEVNVTLLQQCKAQVCTALWGEGNPDVSGVGVRIDSPLH